MNFTAHANSIWCGLLAIVLFLVGASGCLKRSNEQASQDDPDMPPCEVTIPSDVPKTILLEDKEHNKWEANGIELYTGAYKQGWKEFWELYKGGAIELSDTTTEPALVQEFGIEGRGRLDGFKQCRLAIIMKIKEKDGKK